MNLTFQDAVESLIDYQGAEVSQTVLRDAKKAVTEALREITSAHPWTYLYKHGRIETTSAYGQGTISFQATGGTYPNQVTLVGGQWPTWAPWGVLRIGTENYEVERRISSTVLTMRPPMAPHFDFVGLSYGLFQVSYPLPEDFMSQDVTFIPRNFGGLCYVHPREWLLESASWAVLGDPLIFTIMQDRHHPNRMAMFVAPFPTYFAPVDFLYKRHLRSLDVFKSSTGTVSTAAGYNTVTGLGVNFTTNMAHTCVIRVSGIPGKLPTSEVGENPAVWESKIICVETAQRLLTLEPAPASLTNMPYTVSAVVDIEHIMEQAFRRRCEYQMCIGRKAKNKDAAYSDYKVALAAAKAADSRSTYPRHAGPAEAVRRRLKDYPIDLTREA
jgi:hypothetical protein